MKNNKGIGHTLFIVAILVIGSLGFAGWYVWDHNKKSTSSADSVQLTEIKLPAELSSKKDLTSAIKLTSSLDLDTALNSGALNVDINALQ